MGRLCIVTTVSIGVVLMLVGLISAEIKPGKKNVSLELSGQVHRGVLMSYDGENTDFFNVDNDSSSTRFRLVGTYKGSNGISVGARLETQLESNSTIDVSQINKRDNDDDFFSLRKAEIWFDTPYGRMWFGQGSTASDGSSEADLSGTALIAYSSVSDTAAGILFYDDAAGALTGTAVGNVFANFDGLGRDERVGYDSPTIAGFQLSASWVTSDDHWDIAARYARDYGQIKVASAIAYSQRKPSFDSRLSGSLSILHSSGLNGTFAGGFDDLDNDDRDPYFTYFKLGYTKQLFSFGQSSFAIDYYHGEEIEAIDDEAQSVGFGFVQTVDALATEFYIGFRNYDLDREGADLNNVFAVLTGARIKF